MKPVNVSHPIIYRDHFDFDVTQHSNIAEEMFGLVTKYDVTTSVEIGKTARSTANTVGVPGYKYIANDVRMVPFVEYLKGKIQYLKQVWKIDDYPYFISNAWYNEHYEGDWTDEHAHGPCIVVSAYVQKPEGSGDLLVRDPMTEYRASELMNVEPWRRVSVSQGDVLFFPGWLRHKTEENNTSERRMILSLNITPLHGYEFDSPILL